MRKLLTALVAPALLVAGLATAPSAQAAEVTLQVSAGLYPAAVRSCPVSVPTGADGVTVLEAAKTSGCISSYTTQTFPGLGRFVVCIDGICQQADGLATYWEMRDNERFTEYGIDGFRADPGDRLTFTYTNFATFVVG